MTDVRDRHRDALARQQFGDGLAHSAGGPVTMADFPLRLMLQAFTFG